MENYTHSRTIYIVEGDPDLSLSAKCLLEARNKSVKLIQDASDFLTQDICKPLDTVLLDLDPYKPLIFRLLNTLLFSAERPNIVVTTHDNSCVKPDDIFPGNRIKVLVHPIIPTDLVKAIEHSV